MARQRGFEKKYSDQQREAVLYAAVDLEITPARLIAQLARDGELRLPGGDVKCEAFEIPTETVRVWKNEEKHRREGLSATKLTELPAVDAATELRKRLVASADHATVWIRTVQRRQKGELDLTQLEQGRRLARMVREIAAIPEPRAASTAPAPDERVDGRAGGGGSLLAALRREKDE